MEKVRLQKIIAESGFCSRRKAEELIAQKRVKVNGRTAGIGDKANPYKDLVTVDDEKIYLERKRSYRYIMTVSYTHLDVYKRQTKKNLNILLFGN